MLLIRCMLCWEAARTGLANRVRRDEAGVVSGPWVVLTGIMVVAAAAIGVLVYHAVQTHAQNVVNTINGAAG
jgi:hypothetical protein